MIQLHGLYYKHIPNRVLNKSWKFNNKQPILYYSDLEQAYVPSKIETKNANLNYFKRSSLKAEPFSLILPPPNITGNLHLGHALTATIEDIIVRWKMMQGIETVWVPGLDHAGIATQVIVEKQLWRKEQKTRDEIGREKFLEHILRWKENKAEAIGAQLKRLGLSLNWDRQVFTMDPGQAKILSEIFVNLFEKGLVYRQDSLVNWSCFLRSAISDIEVDHIEIDGSTAINVPGYEKPVRFGRMIYFAYKIRDSDEEIVTATTRPETILGDVALAVHPNDSRYTNFVGKYVVHPFRKETIPIIADEIVDMEYGTGVVKITPAHDHTDFFVGKRHALKTLQVFDERGAITDICEDYKGLRRFEVRNMIVDKLQSLNLLRDIKEHKMKVPICSRSGDVIEFLLRPQWFVRCTEMAERAVNDVKDGSLSIEPKNFQDQWFHWLENIRDWCISRQLWWGHRIPAYLCKYKGKEIWLGATDINNARKNASKLFGTPGSDIIIEQDSDVLDTWFSSALMPFSVFGGPNTTLDMSKYFPLSIMETGHDILFFWVARMVMLGREITGELPFRKILLHGIICDSHGRKMSKSLGNVISPDHVIGGITLDDLQTTAKLSEECGLISRAELAKAVQNQKKMFPEGIPECGADALRFTLVSHNTKSHFINFDIQECYTNKLFCNKIWQATKFTKLWYEKVTASQGVQSMTKDNIGLMDKWILSRYSNLLEILNDSLEKYDFYVATMALKEFLYYDLCDVYLESCKRGLREVESKTAAGHCWTLLTVLEGGLRALHPFMPYLTVHLHQSLPLLSTKEYYYPNETHWKDVELENTVENVLRTVKGIRRLKKIFGVTKKHNAAVQIDTHLSELMDFKETIKDLSNCGPVSFMKGSQSQENGSVLVKDVLSNKVVIHLSIPEELRSCLQMDQAKLKKQKDKLSEELGKIVEIKSGINTKIKLTEKNRKIYDNKVLLIEEKLTRINYLLSIL